MWSGVGVFVIVLIVVIVIALVIGLFQRMIFARYLP